MKLSRRTLAITLGVSGLTAVATATSAETEDDAALIQSVEALRKTMMAKDKNQFELLCADELTYGHSSGQVQGKPDFIAGATNPKWHWNSLEFVKLSTKSIGDIGIARMNLVGVFENAEGKVTSISDGVLMVWKRQGNQWKLLARQAYKT
jgi:ketosteroid isomerase-like protein